MQSFRERLASGEILVSDGAIGTRLIAAGMKVGDCPELLSVERPELLAEITKSYVDAGSDLVATNTFGASPMKLARHGLAARAEELNRAAVHIAREAAEDRAYVAASIGPTGQILQPYGEADPAEVYASYATQVATLVDAGADLVLIETMTDAREAVLAVEAAREVASVPIGATMTFDPTPRGFFTIMGVTVEQACRALVDAGADFVGSNCGNGSRTMTEVARAFATHARVPVIIQSNAGLPEVRGTEISYPEGPAMLAEQALLMLDLGVRIVGGCCGTTDEHIRALRRLVDGRRR